jgi:hypothetical protein
VQKWHARPKAVRSCYEVRKSGLPRPKNVTETCLRGAAVGSSISNSNLGAWQPPAKLPTPKGLTDSNYY